MSEEMNKEAEVQEEAVDIPVTDGSEEEAADTARAAAPGNEGMQEREADPAMQIRRIMKNMIASQKKGNVEMGLNYHNLMEDIVLQHVDRILEADGCCCDICKSDVIAYALNHLPPQYVVTDTGRMMVKLKNCDSQNRTDVLAALSNAVKLIRDNPRH